MTQKTAGHDDHEKFVATSISELRTAYDAWQPLAAESTKARWHYLGMIHAASAVVEESPEKRRALVRAANNDPMVGSQRFDAHTAPAHEIYVALLTKIDKRTASAKSRYTHALENARAEGVPPTLEAFVTWVRGKGGITEAARARQDTEIASAPASGEAPTASDPAFKFREFRDWVPTALHSSETVPLKFAEEDRYEGFSVVLVYTAFAADHTPQVVGKMGEAMVVRHVAKAYADRRRERLTPEEKNAHDRRVALWVVNRIALTLAGKLSGKVRPDDVAEFRKAANTLQCHDFRVAELFGGGEGALGRRGDNNDLHTLPVVNPEFNELDPGRYMSRAKAGALFGYDPSGDIDAAISAYVKANQNVWVYLDSSEPVTTATKVLRNTSAQAVQFASPDTDHCSARSNKVAPIAATDDRQEESADGPSAEMADPS